MNDFIPDKQATIAVGISGGVDSSVTAYLLKEAGYHVVGIFMKNWEESFSAGYCTVEEDIEDARDVCETLGIELHTVNFVKEYHERVFKLFLDEYAAGRTPNPDVLCNREIKFAELAHYAAEIGADYLATGHYARRGQHDGQAALFKGVDAGKDQSYFLHQMTPAQLAKALFPLGGMEKSEVRRIAEQAGLITFDKKDSTGICFIGERPFREFLAQYLPAKPGKMETAEGIWIGEHMGLMYYTIGQRQGLGIGGVAGASDEPWYVLDKDLARNVLVVGQGEHPLLYHRRLRAGQLSWLNEVPEAGRSYTAKVRYRQQDQACRVVIDGDVMMVTFDEPQRAVTPGQYVVIYDGARCLGGGVIEERFQDGGE
ncbi:tRNA 2-thiouridine(34) synthase MnmA [Cardiobacteriaceae bacterium TAE3-ERU3]|nr:tRNA 2-thiouridine(34) synthase MnmA [Cardiobacteriaceae bacterium TAE3-ERU3]